MNSIQKNSKSFILFNKFYILRYLNLVQKQKKTHKNNFKIVQFKNLNKLIKNN